ncbi:MAG: UDP-N-acetylmuramoyl-L-alanine--D-glutamate ligase, partial [Deltaproteobacteria bacterium]|nr:UDP-N-acetylmuramoyl-L-alanine--D-glutamate ligase [Deltaproteobacteria bacterium]
MNLKEKKILVIGLGKTGIATARFLIGRGARVVVTDEKPRSELKDVLDEIESTKTQFTFGDY